ncbi:MAG: tRNA pseudouridine(55) synthase, partial [Actinobacteria bacterium]|nr:tRNA pseudouridine(55) synthase [Actinomycetota bacterium]NIS30907.1 tRNA pseudouridine(55) synthase [Actinomycetota bacterium]NIU66087.1 tRNA pseudouridine(55) synthase [Actinomycetota bacterium]NIW27892.1 tRNA pseudouridine(55) synthase [Actinomycetota bacterium]NIX20393.1 tRNA pseudouridine(55) synthase [Actinomycetota bacterium]
MDVTRRALEDLVPSFTGTVMQVPPMVSALKVGGRRLHEIAREGGEVERRPRPVRIHEIEILDVGPGPYPDVSFRVRCGKGTYVRTLAD